ncbi:MAG: AAA family ATPase [Hyphomicrobiales bacterium]|nr:AAA family ATPase [Hyphomicrobiales bacterium]
MDELGPFIVFAVMVLLVAVPLWRRFRRRTPANAPAQDQTPADPAAEATPAERVTTLAARARDFFHDSDHPSEMLTNDSFTAAVDLLSRADDFSAENLAGYLRGGNMVMACMASAALHRHPDAGRIWRQALEALPNLGAWQFHFLLPYLAQAAPSGEAVIGRALVLIANDLSHPMNQALAVEFIRARQARGEPLRLGAALDGLDRPTLATLREFLVIAGGTVARPLVEEIDAVNKAFVDKDYLNTVGKVWDGDRRKAADDVIVHPALDEAYNDLIGFALVTPPRSLLLVGEAGVGKTALLESLTARLYDDGWTVFEVGQAEIVAGQAYLGELEERLGRLVREAGAGQRVVWRIPDLPNLVYAGVHKFSPVSALDTLLPAIDGGEILVLSEATPQTWEQLQLSRPRISGAFAVHRMAALPDAAAKDLAAEWLRRWTQPPADTATLLDETWELAQQYLGDRAAPGNLLELLGLALEQVEADERGLYPTLVLDDVYLALAKVTGLPATLLDDRQRLDLDDLRGHFERQVKGQDEAIDALVERVALLKAGLTDPTRPAGVFLFAGPTGTGKTEIAKTLAEWLFGSEHRLVRLDMSELQTPESLDRLLGSYDGGSSGALVDEIREHPFSVILLDEFEKAHPRIWDLFLQVFDDGRLTDRRGRTADFRHAIIILTSNLGAVIPTGVSLGFRQDSPGFDTGAVHKAVEEAFRKEFVNRLDRVVVFRPLSRDTMREILEKELHAVLRRRGFRSKAWAVEWDDSAIDFLLSRGFTPDLGARPLKRAVERYFLAPLAMTIVAHRAPEGEQFLFVTGGARGIDVRFVDPDAPEDEAADRALDDSDLDAGDIPLTPAAIALRPRGLPEEMAVLRARLEEMEAAVQEPDWTARKAAALAAMEAPGFWQSDDRFALLTRTEYQDRVEYALGRARALLGRLQRGSRSGRSPQEMLGTLGQNLYLLQHACADVRDGRPTEAYLAVDSGPDMASDGAGAAAFAEQIGAMYQAWAQKRRMRAEVLAGPTDPGEGRYRLVMSVTGFAAYAILAPEAGLHVLEVPGAQKGKFERVGAFVAVAPQDGRPPPGKRKSRLGAAERALEEAACDRGRIVRRYRREPSPLVRDTARDWRTGRIERVLGGDFDLFGGE